MASLVPRLDTLPDAQQKLWPSFQPLAGLGFALYGPAFQSAECLKALVYFQGGDLETLPADTRDALIHAVAGSGPLPKVAVVSHALTLATSHESDA